MTTASEPLGLGNVVLRGTSPTRMTIDKLVYENGAHSAHVVWFEGTTAHLATYPLDELRRARDPRPLVTHVSDALVEMTARVCHEANRGFCLTQGDATQPAWDDAEDWQRDSSRIGARGVLSGEIVGPEESHESWLREKVATGWVYGAEKNPKAKEHPCMVPYAELPPFQRMKDHIFHGIVRAIARGVNDA